jgi:hypothetical protein
MLPAGLPCDAEPPRLETCFGLLSLGVRGTFVKLVKEAQPIRTLGDDEEVFEKSLRNWAKQGFWVPAKALWRTTGFLSLEPMQKDRKQRQMGVYWPAAERQNRNSG